MSYQVKPEWLALLRQKLWRLQNLYVITDKAGKKVRFKMTQEQLDYYNGMHNRNIILKARQLGFTTEQCIIQLDAALFESAKCALIAHTLPDAHRLFREKVKFAYDNLPDEIKQANPARNDSAGELVFSKGGSLYVSTSFRGGTLRYLHVSEFGKICAKYPHKAREIVTGAFEAVAADCFITIESTAEGRAGYFFDYSDSAEKHQIAGRPLGRLDWKFFFFSWWRNAGYAEPVLAELPQRLTDYFTQLEQKHGVVTTPEQRAWYWSKEKTLGDDMKREYPSIPAEAFQQSVEGAYYATQFAKIYEQKRITKLPDNSHQPVFTIWDIGVGDSTAIWFVRQVGEEYHVIDFYENSGEGLRHYMKVIKDRGYTYSEHWGPHDIDNREFGSDGKTRREIAREGYEIDGKKYSLKFTVVPKLGIDDGIEAVREILQHCWFDDAKTEQGVKALESYRKEWDDKRGCWKDKPLHDWCFTSDTRLLTRNGMQRIVDLPKTGEVWTLCGWKKYQNPRKTKQDALLVEVLFANGSTVRCTPEHKFLTANGWKSAESLEKGFKILSGLTQQPSTFSESSTGYTRVSDTLLLAEKDFIEQFGATPLAKSLKDATYTTSTKKKPTTRSAILSACQRLSIWVKVFLIKSNLCELARAGLAMMQKKLLPTGMLRLLAESGIGSTLSPLKAGQSGSESSKNATGARTNTKLLFETMATSNGFATQIAKLPHIEVQSVTRLSVVEDVYCLTVPGVEHFTLANGAVVHNCSHAADAFRYFAVAKKRRKYSLAGVS
jgi:hypothetical protein